MRLGLDFLFQYEGITSDMLIWGIFLAVSIAAVIAWIDRRFRGVFIRALLKAGALDAETARTVKEMGCAKNLFVRFALCRRGSSLRSMLERITPEENADAAASARPQYRYYIPERSQSKARALYEAKGSGFGTVLLTVVLFLALALLAINLTGTLTSMIEWAFGTNR